ncbi:Phospholipid N-methyltransferase [Paenibacillus algorifonticola]|uniref:Phospholipid N-methyltransferase n=1 Tax=Paenibacillus algorifonticola TaxID=684063 RepID=A0A1I2FVY0_9BACL|nr:methyltransferase domain-containing protein [Paenibacillus algorifonticola]SFF08988.1 Phospholipid N-methyltransferase [Paenibacillus algorifonticola]
MNIKECLLFLQRFIQSPKRVGSVMPSSRFLATKMVSSMPLHGVKAVAELGSGTGAITRFIKKRLSGSAKVLLFEMDDRMRNNLQSEYPDFISHPNACYLVEGMKQEGIEQLDCIISGLPFFNFSSELRETLLNQTTQALKPDGTFIAFQYSLQMKKQFSKKFIIEKIEWVPFNFPPAFVYTCRKRDTL